MEKKITQQKENKENNDKIVSLNEDSKKHEHDDASFNKLVFHFEKLRNPQN